MKVTVIALGLLLVGSLATSGYLLIERKANVQKITEAQGETKKVRKTNLDLTEEKTQAQKSFYEAKANLTIASNSVTQAQEEIESLKTKSASELADLQSKLSAADDKETTLNGELLTRDEKITQLAADQNATQTKLKTPHISVSKTNSQECNSLEQVKISHATQCRDKHFKRRTQRTMLTTHPAGHKR